MAEFDSHRSRQLSTSGEQVVSASVTPRPKSVGHLSARWQLAVARLFTTPDLAGPYVAPGSQLPARPFHPCSGP